MLRVFCKINFSWKYERNKLNIVSACDLMEILQRMYAGSLTVLPQLFWVFWNRDIFFETACIESKILSLIVGSTSFNSKVLD